MLVPLLLLTLASGAAYRVRGSDFLADKTGGRLVKLVIGAFPMALAAMMAGAPLLSAVPILLATVLADTQQHADSMGANGIKQIVGLFAAGALAAAPAMVALAIGGHPVAAAAAFGAGLLKAPAYLIGNRLPVHIDRLELRQGPEIGEALYGAVRVAFAAVG